MLGAEYHSFLISSIHFAALWCP